MAITQNMINNAKHAEGYVPYMYLDTKSKVTVGYGFMLPTADSAKTLEFVKRQGGQKATEAEITTEWQTVSSKGPNSGHHPAHAYKQYTTLDIVNASATPVLEEKLRASENELAHIFHDYYAFPDTVKEALMDMIYNMGQPTLLHSFPTFIKFVRNRDWAGAAKESHRRDVQSERNTLVKDLFMTAAKMTQPEAPPTITLGQNP